MSTENLHQHVAALREAVNALGGADAAAKTRVQQLIADLERHLDNPADAAQQTKVAAAMPGVVEQFEADHPAITQILNRIMVALSGMGI